jgi:hypothetical protein
MITNKHCLLVYIDSWLTYIRRSNGDRHTYYVPLLRLYIGTALALTFVYCGHKPVLVQLHYHTDQNTDQFRSISFTTVRRTDKA